MRVLFRQDWQEYKKDQIVEIDDDLAWSLATQGIVKFKKTPDPVIEKLKKETKDIRRAKKRGNE